MKTSNSLDHANRYDFRLTQELLKFEILKHLHFLDVAGKVVAYLQKRHDVIERYRIKVVFVAKMLL